jgi:hypothetical protein
MTVRPDPLAFAPADMADLLTSGWSGPDLVKLLHQHFPQISRGEAFSACALAASLWHADQLMLTLELAALRRRLTDTGALA